MLNKTYFYSPSTHGMVYHDIFDKATTIFEYFNIFPLIWDISCLKTEFVSYLD